VNIESKEQGTRNKTQERRKKMKTLSQINEDAWKIYKLATTKITWKEAFNLACEVEEIETTIYNHHLKSLACSFDAIARGYEISGDKGRSIAFFRARNIARSSYDLADFFSQKYISSSIRRETLLYFAGALSERVDQLQNEVNQVNPYFSILSHYAMLARFI